MENGERKEKLEIDLNTVKTAQELHFLLKKSLDFPDFYGMNWNAFWDTITGLVELPKQLVFIGWNNISKKLPEEAQILKYYLDEYEKNYNKYIECIIEYH